MPYQSVRATLMRCRKRLQERGDDPELVELVDALEQLTGALESDMMQIKGALSHLANLLEQRGER